MEGVARRRADVNFWANLLQTGMSHAHPKRHNPQAMVALADGITSSSLSCLRAKRAVSLAVTKTCQRRHRRNDPPVAINARASSRHLESSVAWWTSASLRWQKRSPLQTLRPLDTLLCHVLRRRSGDPGTRAFSMRNVAPSQARFTHLGWAMMRPAFARPVTARAVHAVKILSSMAGLLRCPSEASLHAESCFIACWYATCAEGSLQSDSSFAAGLINVFRFQWPPQCQTIP